MDNDERIKENFRKNIYIDKADNILNISIGILFFDIFTYIVALLFNQVDFGILFELVAIVSVIFAKKKLKDKDLSTAKVAVVISTTVIAMLLLYDVFLQLIGKM